MLGYEYERMFDNTLKKVLPYLILSPKEFRDSLADRMAGLFHFLSEKHSEIQFNDLNKKINEMIDSEKRESWDSTIEIKIHDFNGRQMSFDERIRNLNERLTKLENKKEKKSVTTSIPIFTPAPAPVPSELEKEKKRISPQEIKQKLEMLRNHLKTNKQVTNKEARTICNSNIQQARWLLQKLVKENFIEQKGKLKSAYYELKTMT